jgi:hypothetical protein
LRRRHVEIPCVVGEVRTAELEAHGPTL